MRSNLMLNIPSIPFKDPEHVVGGVLSHPTSLKIIRIKTRVNGRVNHPGGMIGPQSKADDAPALRGQAILAEVR
jgi:hypothetical protein